jgi:beta-phosphoglucomutase
MRPDMPCGVIFDMDGVLVDSGPAHAESWRLLARGHGIEISDDQFKATFGQTSRDIIHTLWATPVSDEAIRRYDAEKEHIYRELITGQVPLMPGARELLSSLSQAGHVLAVATSGPAENLQLVLREGDLGRFFAATVTGFDVARGKPAPDCFLLAAERAGLQPGNCVVVEDAPAGIQAAGAAGMNPIGFVGTHPATRLREAGAATTVARLTDITPELVTDLLGRR